jgi:hypothetical protein
MIDIVPCIYFNFFNLKKKVSKFYIKFVQVTLCLYMYMYISTGNYTISINLWLKIIRVINYKYWYL